MNFFSILAEFFFEKNLIYHLFILFPFLLQAEIPLTSVKVDLLYYNTTIAKSNNVNNAHLEKPDKKKIKPSPGMLFMPLYFNVKKVAWENMCKYNEREKYPIVNFEK